MNASLFILCLVALQRLAELWLAARNTRRLLAEGAREHGAGHYPFIVALHALWLAGLFILARDRPVQWGWIALFACLQVGRIWVIATLGRRWTTRIIVPRGVDLVRSGPFRLVPHPNYVVVAAEILVLPLAFGLLAYGVVFTALNAAMMAVRIPAEERALRESAARP